MGVLRRVDLVEAGATCTIVVVQLGHVVVVGLVVGLVQQLAHGALH